MLYSEYSKLVKFTVLGLLFGLSFSLIAQEDSERSILKADSSWSKEIIPFPIEWAPEITFKGFEELRFAPNWSDEEHEEFWTLVMAWQVATKTIIPLKAIQFNFNHYFDALMKPNHWAQEFPEPILKLNDVDITKSGMQFKGNMTFFDGFHTGKVITVNILGIQTLCKTSGKSFLIFRLSPKAFNDSIWKQLNTITLKDDVCLH